MPSVTAAAGPSVTAEMGLLAGRAGRERRSATVESSPGCGSRTAVCHDRVKAIRVSQERPACAGDGDGWARLGQAAGTVVNDG